jgi:hypothetical protein
LFRHFFYAHKFQVHQFTNSNRDTRFQVIDSVNVVVVAHAERERHQAAAVQERRLRDNKVTLTVGLALVAADE